MTIIHGWELVMGLEVHAELSTKTKIFCGCKNTFGSEPNTNVCPICSGMPGVLPKLNRSVVEYAVRLGLTLGCSITDLNRFDRKNYFYPDLPKAYQISQLYAPICRGGSIEVDSPESEGGKKTIGIREIHMEEDAGKLVHDAQSGGTMMDFNRCGVPLLEIVSLPDFRSAVEVLSYLERLREIMLYLDICDCKMQEGSLRADINLSLRRHGGELGVRTEMKNLNSFRAINRAIEYEAARQYEILKDGGQVVQETRRWDDDKGQSFSMRSKEDAKDYRYFPEPDLLPVEISGEWLEEIKKSIPELAHQKREWYTKEYALSEQAAMLLTTHKNISDLFEAITSQSGQPQEASNLITGELMYLMNNAAMSPEELKVSPEKLSALVCLVVGGKINRSVYKEVVELIFAHDIDPMEYIKEKGLMMVSDDGLVLEVSRAVIKENPEAVADYHAGKQKAFGFLMGQAIKRLGKSADPRAVREAMKGLLEEAE